MPNEPLLSVKEVAERLGVKPLMVYRLTYSGDLAFVRVGTLKKFRPEDVQAFLDRNHQPAAASPVATEAESAAA